MIRTLFDGSVLVTAVVDQLGNHEAAFGALHRYTSGRHQGFCSTHTLAECYATLTALPLPTRVLPGEARALVQESLSERLTVIELTVDDYHSVLRQVAKLGLASGAIYDALAQCAQKASTNRILTYNVSDFERFRLPGIAVMTP
ncbi:MAG: VapC toxin family PIN domain ribonuclease [Acidobacteriota bacterium]|nr:VapC toxin family PIN domain ribonuclease [Acidobacteriota bacterium]